MEWNSPRPSTIDRRRDQEEFQVFLAEVLTADYERKTLSIRELRSGISYLNVSVFPATSSSNEGTDVDMPEPGTRCVAATINYAGGFSEAAVLSYVTSDTVRAQQGVATRAIDDPAIEGRNRRTRGTYRKAYPGQKTVTRREGYSERQSDGWDRLAADHSRDRLDAERRTWTQIASRRVGYTDGALTMEGPVERPGAASLVPELLPDGSSRSIAYLAPGATAASRYQGGAQDAIALVERTRKVQEFALDFPVPAEALETPLLDAALGTTASLWGRTSVLSTAGVGHDDQSSMISQAADHPYYTGLKAVGPTTGEGATPRRRGFILERSEGTLVGSNSFDPSTYGQPLKPVVFPLTAAGRFETSPESGYLPAAPSPDHAETRLAASASSTRFPHEGNTTRWDTTKEGLTVFELGSTLPRENTASWFSGGYEHPHGAGRSLEGHLVGSVKLVVGKNRDEEDAIDLQALGQTVLRLGSDDCSLPNARRQVSTQIRGSKDAVQARTLQYWAASKLSPGDPVSLAAKQGGESVSLRAAFDGGTVMRLGARDKKALRRHFVNGYRDAQGVVAYSTAAPDRIDSKSPGRPAYAAGDAAYQFHDLTQAGKSQLNLLPYAWSGSPVPSMDASGLSLDIHAVRDALLRAGRNEDSGQSLLVDLAGGAVACLGKDNQGRSLTATLDGGIELVIGPNAQKKGLRLEINGDVDWTVLGHFNLNVTGDFTVNSNNYQQIAMTDILTKAQRTSHVSLVRHVTECPEMVDNQGAYADDPDS